MSFGSRVPYASRVMPSSPARQGVRPARAGGPRDRAPGAHGKLLDLAADARVRVQLQGAAALEDDEDLLLGRVHVRRVHELPRRHDEMREPGPLRPGGVTQVPDDAAHAAVLAVDRLDVREVDDARRPLGQLVPRRRPDSCLAGPRVVLGRTLEHPGRSEPGNPGARQQRVGRVVTLPEREHDEPLVPRADRVRVLEREVNEAVALPHGEGTLRVAVPLIRDPGAREDVEDLLLRALEMERRRPPARLDRDPLHAGGNRVRSRERLPRRRDVPPLPPFALDLVPVGDHADTLDDGEGRAPRRSPARHCSGGHRVARERVSEPDHGLVGGITSLHPHPRFGVVQEARAAPPAAPPARQRPGRAPRSAPTAP